MTANSVWVLFEGGYSDRSEIAAFTTQQLAEQAGKNLTTLDGWDVSRIRLYNRLPELVTQYQGHRAHGPDYIREDVVLSDYATDTPCRASRHGLVTGTDRAAVVEAIRKMQAGVPADVINDVVEAHRDR